MDFFVCEDICSSHFQMICYLTSHMLSHATNIKHIVTEITMTKNKVKIISDKIRLFKIDQHMKVKRKVAILYPLLSGNSGPYICSYSFLNSVKDLIKNEWSN